MRFRRHRQPPDMLLACLRVGFGDSFGVKIWTVWALGRDAVSPCGGDKPLRKLTKMADTGKPPNVMNITLTVPKRN